MAILATGGTSVTAPDFVGDIAVVFVLVVHPLTAPSALALVSFVLPAVVTVQCKAVLSAWLSCSAAEDK